MNAIERVCSAPSRPGTSLECPRAEAKPPHRRDPNGPARLQPKRRRAVGLSITTVVLAVIPAAQAHTATGTLGGLLSGFTHPLTGLDHMVAMVAVGLWGAFLGSQALWMLPVVFPLVMAVGGGLGILGVPIPAVETGIALSGIVLGLLVAGAIRPPLWIAAVVVGLFGLFHGHAHGTELPKSGDALAYSIGFVTSTGLLHLAGIAFGLLAKWPWGRTAVRVGGGVIAGIGFGFLLNLL